MAKPTESETTHPLVEPRVLAAIAVVALGCGVGFGLMLAKLFITIGLLVSLGSALAVTWIYWTHFGRAYRALRHRQVYDGIGVTEIIIALAVIIAVVPLSVAIYIAESTNGPIVNRAIMEFEGAALDPSGLPGLSRVEVVFTNMGNLIATNSIGVVAAVLMDKPMEQAVEIKILDYFAHILDTEQQSRLQGREIDLGKGIVVHALKVASIKAPSDLQHADNSNLFLIDQDSLRGILSGKKVMYVLYVVRWEDGYILGQWENRGCIAYTGPRVDYLRHCPPITHRSN